LAANKEIDFMKPRSADKIIFPFASLLILLACQIPLATGLSVAAATSTLTAVQTAPQTATATVIWTATATATPIPTETPSPTLTPTFAPPARRVVIVSIDSLRPDAILPAPMHNVISLMQSGAFSLGAQTVFPSVTLVGHASMLSGMCPSKHGVDWNDYLPERGYAKGTDLFDIAHAAGLRTEMYFGKKKMIQLVEPPSLDNSVFVDRNDSALMDRLIADFPQDFGVLFVHLPETDERGHGYGWLSPEQLSVIRGADQAIGRLLAELERRNLRGETLIFVTSDHGGNGFGHGSASRENMTIPWIASGPGIQPKTLTTAVHTMDTAATAAFALGLNIPTEWDGVPVYEAFGLPVPTGKQSMQCPF
jgi:type I phosphodiesterase/nucleotide pyrophosphatase